MYKWAVFIHRVFAAFWLGGMLFTAAVVVPAIGNSIINSLQTKTL